MWGRAAAALLPGLLLAAALTGLLAWLPPGPWPQMLVVSLISFVPLWMLTALWAFSFRTSLRAWLTLGGAAAVAFALLGLLRLSGAVH